MPQHGRRCRLDRSRDCDGRPQSGAVQPFGRIWRRHQGLPRKTKACLYQALKQDPQRTEFRETQNGWECRRGVAKSRPFARSTGWRATSRSSGGPDGVIILKSRIPLQAYEKHIPASLAKWAKQAPERIWLAQRGGPDRQWRKVSYGEAKRTVDALTQGLLNLGIEEWPPRYDPLRQFDRARADDAGRDAGAPAGRAGVAGLFADEPGSRQTQIPLQPDQACRRDGAGRPDL